MRCFTDAEDKAAKECERIDDLKCAAREVGCRGLTPDQAADVKQWFDAVFAQMFPTAAE